MLKDIAELRYAIVPEDENAGLVPSAINSDDGTSFLFGATFALSFEQILSQYLPSRQEGDRLVAAYFRANSVVAPLIHASHFRRRYQQFWMGPQTSSPLWTSIFFSVCHIASNTLTVRQEGMPFENKYLLASAQCLAVGKYYKPQPFAVESLLLFAQAKCFGSLDIISEHGIIMASVIRLATSSGYHRDPDIFNISGFDKEMRRRTWSLCVQLDLLISFALGLPSPLPAWDTKVPRNFRDSDFDEDMVELPEARPDSEPTNLLFYIAKYRLMTVFEKILRHVLSPRSSSMTDVDELETKLGNIYSTLPVVLQPRSMSDSVVDSPSLIITRLCVLFLYQKCRCVLHRRYAASGRKESVHICYQASTSIVGYFLDIYEDLQPGGQLETERWFNSTLTWHDFLLGVMVLCLVLCVSSQSWNQAKIDYTGSMSLLRRAKSICAQVSYNSRNTKRVQKLIDATISRLENVDDQTGRISTTNGHEFAHISGLPVSMSDPGAAGTAYEAKSDLMQGTVMVSNGYSWTSSWNDAVPAPLDDFSWTYLEQFLNLPNDDTTMDL